MSETNAGSSLSPDEVSTAMEPGIASILPSNTDALADWYEMLSGRIHMIVVPIITLAGILGNSLSLAVVHRPAMRGRSSTVYMAALAVADSIVLLLDFVNNWINNATKVYLLGTSDAFCRFHRWFLNVSYTYAAWLVVALTVERFIAVVLPFKARWLCRRRYALATVTLLPLPIVALYLVHLWAWFVDADGVCTMTHKFNWYVSYVDSWIVGTFYSYAPFLVLSFCSGAIIVQLLLSRALRQTMTETGDRPADDPQMKKDHKQDTRITIMVVIVCVSFLLLTTPVTLFYSIIYGAGLFHTMGPKLVLVETFMQLIGLSNHAINFWLYVASSKGFRRELRAMFCCRGAPSSADSSQPLRSSQHPGLPPSTNDNTEVINLAVITDNDNLQSVHI